MLIKAFDLILHPILILKFSFYEKIPSILCLCSVVHK